MVRLVLIAVCHSAPLAFGAVRRTHFSLYARQKQIKGPPSSSASRRSGDPDGPHLPRQRGHPRTATPETTMGSGTWTCHSPPSRETTAQAAVVASIDHAFPIGACAKECSPIVKRAKSSPGTLSLRNTLIRVDRHLTLKSQLPRGCRGMPRGMFSTARSAASAEPSYAKPILKCEARHTFARERTLSPAGVQRLRRR
jgi:hypothetical protein